MLERDEGFVVDSWAESFWHSHFSGVLPKPMYQAAHREHFTQVLKRPDVEVLMAVNRYEDDPRHELFGCLVWEKWTQPIVHWVYTSWGTPTMRMRRQGVATALFRAARIDPSQQMIVASCITADVFQIKDAARQRGVFLQVKHDPRFLRDPEWKDRADAKRAKRREIPRTYRRSGGSSRDSA